MLTGKTKPEQLTYTSKCNKLHKHKRRTNKLYNKSDYAISSETEAGTIRSTKHWTCWVRGAKTALIWASRIFCCWPTRWQAFARSIPGINTLVDRSIQLLTAQMNMTRLTHPRDRIHYNNSFIFVKNNKGPQTLKWKTKGFFGCFKY